MSLNTVNRLKYTKCCIGAFILPVTITFFYMMGRGTPINVYDYPNLMPNSTNYTEFTIWPNKTISFENGTYLNETLYILKGKRDSFNIFKEPRGIML